MHVTELNDDELFELKEALYYNYYSDADLLTYEQRVRVEDSLCTENVPIDIVYAAFGGIDFVKDDFWCNA